MRKAFHLLLVSLGCLHLTGGPYAVIQVYAWATMLVDYSKDDGLLKATKDTLSGEKPCALCCRINAAQQDQSGEKNPLLPLSPRAGKFLQEMIPTGIIQLKPPRVSSAIPVAFGACPMLRGILPAGPPVPPPRVAV